MDGESSLVSSVELVSAPGPAEKKINAQGDKGVSSFVNKLYNMIEDEKHQEYIHWTPSGSFVVINSDQFAREVLPQYFKHNNFASFVRQLNMYGFHKVNDFINVNPSPEAANQLEFSHPAFKRGKREFLIDVKRRGIAKAGNFESDPNGRIQLLEEKLKLAHDVQQALYNDGVQLRIQLNNLQHIVNSLVQHISSSEDDGTETGMKRKRFTMDTSVLATMNVLPVNNSTLALLAATAPIASSAEDQM